MGPLLTYVAIALLVSFLCSLWEATLLSVTPSYIAALEKRHATSAQPLRRLKEDIDRPLAAILTLNTAAHTLGAAGAGAQAAILFGSAYVGVFSAALTLAILLFTEILPKTLGALYWRQLAPPTARILTWLIPPLWPFVWISRQMARRIGGPGRPAPAHWREEFAALAELGSKEGMFHVEEARALRNLLRMGSVRTSDIMTPRIVVFAVPETHTVGQVLRTHLEIRFSRIPIFRDGLDDVTGYVLKDDLLLAGARDQHDRPMADLRREILVVPGTLPISQLLERFLDSREHVALVVDEYGGTAGVVSMEDVVETVLGLEIVGEADRHKDMQELAREEWLKRARRLGLVGEDFVEGRRAD